MEAGADILNVRSGVTTTDLELSDSKVSLEQDKALLIIAKIYLLLLLIEINKVDKINS